jgi:hypothetical protein
MGFEGRTVPEWRLAGGKAALCTGSRHTSLFIVFKSLCRKNLQPSMAYKGVLGPLLQLLGPPFQFLGPPFQFLGLPFQNEEGLSPGQPSAGKRTVRIRRLT